MYPTRLRPDPRTRANSDGSTTDLIAQDPNAAPFLAGLTRVSSGDVDLSPYAVDMNQLSLNACAGNSTGEAVEVLNSIAGYQKVPVSRLFIYNMARQETGDLQHDQGTYVRACFDILSRFGVCDEYIWPYDPSKVFTSPSMMAQRQAAGHRIKAYYRITETGDALCQAVIDALRANHPVVFGTQVSLAYEQLNSDAPQGPPIGQPLAGGHAQCILGYINGNFLVKNSWGRNWGANGYAMYRPDYISWDESFDFWVPTLGVDLAA